MRNNSHHSTDNVTAIKGKKSKFNTRDLTSIAIFATLTAALAQITIPLPFTPVPINFAVLAVLVSGSFMGSSKGLASQVVYILLGVVGLPVFAGFRGGFGVITGATGGYVLGYLAVAFLAGLAHQMTASKILAMSIGVVALYTLGTAWFIFVTQTSIIQAVIMCVLPFVIGEIIKIIMAILITKRLSKIIM